MRSIRRERIITVALCAGICISCVTLNVNAKEKTNDKIEAGIYAGDINLEGMTASEAKKEVQAYVDSFADTEIVMHAIDDGTITVTASELGLKWKNKEIIDEAASLGKKGNIVQCYKALKDLPYEYISHSHLPQKNRCMNVSYTCVTYSAVTVKSGFITHTKNIYRRTHLHTIAHHHTHSCHAVIFHGVISFPFILTAYHYSTKIPNCQANLSTYILFR